MLLHYIKIPNLILKDLDPLSCRRV